MPIPRRATSIIEEIKEVKQEIKQEIKNLGTKLLIGKKPDRHPLSAYRFFPERAEFTNKDPDEKVVLLVRKHFLTNVPWIFMFLLMLVAPIVLKYFPIIDFMPDRFQFIAILGWYLITTAYVLESFLTWYFNVNILTDERVIDVNFSNLVYREISEANIDQIQEVTVRMGSPFRTVFTYGDVLIQTASEKSRLEFEGVPHPDKIAKIIRELRVEEEQEKIEGRVR